MTAYRGHLTTVVGDGPEVVLKLSGHTVRVLTPDGRVHTWPSQDVRVTGISGDRFWIAFQGEIAVFAPEEPQAFMLEFLPGLKAARTVADSIAASQPPTDAPNDRARPDRPAEEHPNPATSDEQIDLRRPRVAAHRPRLPQLAEHVEASRNGQREAGDPIQEEQIEARQRWWSRGQSAPPLRPSPGSTPDSSPVSDEEINVDLTDQTLEGTPDDMTISAAVVRTESGSLPDEDPPADEGGQQNSPLRKLANRNDAFQAERRGTYRPRR